MWHIINALILRELKTRFGNNPKLGYLWVIFEPMMHLLFMLLIFAYIRNRVLPQVPFLLFLIVGMVPFFMFRNTLNFLINGISANKALFAYKPLRPIHVFIARSLLEALIYGAILLIMLIFYGFFADYNVIPKNIVICLFLYCWIVFFAFTLGLFLAVVAHGFDFVKRIMSYASFGLYFGTAIMYPLWIMPPIVSKILYYNPILHIFETLKDNFFYNYPLHPMINLSYPIICNLVLLFFALGIYHKKRVELVAG